MVSRETVRTVREAVAIAGAISAPVTFAAGVLLGRPGIAVAGIVLLLAAVIAGRPIVTYREILRDVSDRSRRAQIRAWMTLKVVGILVHLILLAAVGLLSIAAGARLGILEVGTFPAETIRAALGTFAAALVAGLAVTHHLSMRVRLERAEAAYGIVGALAGAGATLVVAGLAYFVGQAPIDLGSVRLAPTDTPFLHLGAAVLAGAAVYSARSAPTLSLLVVGEEEYYRGATHLSRERSIAAPALAAVGLLMAFLVGTMVLISGVGGLVGTMSGSVAVSGLVVALVVVAVGAVVVAVTFWRGGEEVPTYRARPDRAERRDQMAIAVSLAAGMIFASIAGLLWSGRPVLGLDPALWLDVGGLALLGGMAPAGVWFDRKIRRERALEERFPDLLRDLASSRQAGLTLGKAVRIASRGDYGALDPEIDRMADQLAWNVSFQDALQRFADRVDTPLVRRSLALIEQADRAGGDVAGVLHAAARDAQEIKTLEQERRSSMGIYTAIIYVTFFVFLGVAAALFASFIPEIVSAVEQLGESGAGFSGIQLGVRTIAEYRSFYMTAALVQAVGNGIVAGKIETGHLTSGLKHAAVMVAITLVTFVFLL